ncbi:hypothetical protein HOY82DRAFT_274484 [Tuber indicum]|nr:hypothetical protein HOY82DRAFT_274484 [Tuber indicum]
MLRTCLTCFQHVRHIPSMLGLPFYQFPVRRFTHPSVCSFVRLFVRLFVCSFIHPPIGFFVHRSVPPLVRPSVHPLDRFPIRSFVHQPVSLFARPSVCSFICPLIRRFFRRFVGLFVLLSVRSFPACSLHSICLLVHTFTGMGVLVVRLGEALPANKDMNVKGVIAHRESLFLYFFC